MKKQMCAVCSGRQTDRTEYTALRLFVSLTLSLSFSLCPSLFQSPFAVCDIMRGLGELHLSHNCFTAHGAVIIVHAAERSRRLRRD